MPKKAESDVTGLSFASFRVFSRPSPSLFGGDDADPEDVFHALRHLASNQSQVRFVKGEEPSEDKFSLKE